MFGRIGSFFGWGAEEMVSLGDINPTSPQGSAFLKSGNEHHHRRSRNNWADKREAHSKRIAIKRRRDKVAHQSRVLNIKRAKRTN